MNKIKRTVAEAFHDQHGNIVRLASEAGVDKETIKISCTLTKALICSL